MSTASTESGPRSLPIFTSLAAASLSSAPNGSSLSFFNTCRQQRATTHRSKALATRRLYPGVPARHVIEQLRGVTIVVVTLDWHSNPGAH